MEPVRRDVGPSCEGQRPYACPELSTGSCPQGWPGRSGVGTVVGMRGWWQDLTDLVLPAECGGCGRPRTVLCPECRAALMGAVPSRVRPVPEPPGLPVVHAAAPYEDEVRAALLAHKERGALMLAGPLGVALAGAVRAGLATAAGTGAVGRVVGGPVRVGRVPGGSFGDGRAAGGPVGVGGFEIPVSLVPVPSARRAVRARGHDPARRIALAAAGELRRTGRRPGYSPYCGSDVPWPTSRGSTPGSGWTISPAPWRCPRGRRGCWPAAGGSCWSTT